MKLFQPEYLFPCGKGREEERTQRIKSIQICFKITKVIRKSQERKMLQHEDSVVMLFCFLFFCLLGWLASFFSLLYVIFSALGEHWTEGNQPVVLLTSFRQAS